MRRLGVWGLEVALLLGLGMPSVVLGAGKDDWDDNKASQAPEQGSWFSRMFGAGKKAEPKKESACEKETLKKTSERPLPPRKDAGAERARDEAAFFRRLAVCDQLKQIALQNKDDQMLRKAEELDRRVYESYSRRMSAAATGGTPFESDEQVLEKHLGAGSAKAGKLPSARSSLSEEKDRNKRSASRDEEKP